MKGIEICFRALWPWYYGRSNCFLNALHL